MKDSVDPSINNENLCSSLKRLCVNEISIRNHLYIISMCINNCEQPLLDVKIEDKETADQWKSTFDTNSIERMTTKTGNFKSFNVFVTMLENAIYQKSSSASIDIYTCDDLDSIRKKQEKQKKYSNKRYLVLIYNVEYDCIYYPLSLQYSGKTDTIILIGQIHQLTNENQLLKSQLQLDTQRSNIQQEFSHLPKENETSLENSKEKDEQIEYLREMIRTSEDTLIKQQYNLQKMKIKKNDRYHLLMNQIDSLKTTERQLKSKVKNLTNQIDLLKQNRASSNSRQTSSSLSRPTSSHRHRNRSTSKNKRPPSSTDSHVRFDPTAYIHERNLKFQQIQLEKKRETHRRLSSARCQSDSDLSNISLKSNENIQHSSKSNKRSSRKRTNNLHHHHKSKDSIDSDIEQVSPPPILRRSASNNSTILYSPQHSLQNQQNCKTDNLVDIDQRLKSLEKFIQQNFLH